MRVTYSEAKASSSYFSAERSQIIEVICKHYHRELGHSDTLILKKGDQLLQLASPRGNERPSLTLRGKDHRRVENCRRSGQEANVSSW